MTRKDGKERYLDGEMDLGADMVSPLPDEYETEWAPILSPLYRTEKRRSPVAVGKTIAA